MLIKLALRHLFFERMMTVCVLAALWYFDRAATSAHERS